jgi:Fe-S oxidoreductase
MEIYTIFKSAAMAAALIGALGFFFVRIRRLCRLMISVEGKVDLSRGRLADRILVFFADVLGQADVRRKPLIGLAHMLIFFGFIAVQPHSLMLMIQGVFPGFYLDRYFSRLYEGYLFWADILAALALVGLAYAFYRRVVVRPSYLTRSRDAYLILFLTSVIVITFHLINAFLTLPPLNQAFLTGYSGAFPISQPLVRVFDLQALAPNSIRVGYEITWWLHVGTILVFLVYIPGSKHLHILAAAPNVILRRLNLPKAIAKTDLDNEAAQSFGLGKVSDLNWKQVLNLYACTECGRCEEQCPASRTGKPLSPKNVICDVKADLLDQADAVLAKNPMAVQPIIRRGSPVSADVMWACTSCRACEESCPVNIEPLDFIFESRKHLVLMEANFPPEMQATFTNLQNQFNPWGFSSDSRAEWCRGLDVPLMADHPHADLLYFVGCAGAFDGRGKQIAQAMVRVLQKAGVNFAILGPEEACNGDVARRAGNEYLAQMLMQKNAETLNRYRPRKILTSCPHCFNMIKNEYPQFGASYRVVHHTEFLLELIQQVRLKARNETIERITYHDSCYLGRWNGIYQAPRDLLAAINNGRPPLEMHRARARGFCCGAGGARMFMEETIGARINLERAEEVIATGAQRAVVACPFCLTMLRDGIREKNAGLEVKDIVEVVDEVTT